MREINIGQATAITSPDPLMLVCTQKENSAGNLAPVSFFMYASFNPPMLAFATGNETDKLEDTPIAPQTLEGSEIQVPQDTRIAFAVSLAQTVEADGHYLYVCKIEKMLADETREGLFAWDG